VAPKRPDRRRLRAIRDRLRAEYGRPIPRRHRAPIDELVLTVLSQNTNDRNRDVAYARMRARFPTWEAVRAAPVDELEEALRPGGLAPTKALRIKEILDALALPGDPGDAATRGEEPGGGADGAARGGEPGGADGDAGLDDLSRLADMPLEEARAVLCALPGVGRKTAACVLLFSFGLPDIPVDTHVYRVGSRLGLFRPGASFAEAHDELLRLTPPEDAYEVHVLLIRHGRRTCTARAPRCGECPLLRMCPYGRRALSR
jgi:endonuclease III